MNHQGTVELYTNRLTLRRFRLSDAPAMFKNWAGDKQVFQYLTKPAHQSVRGTRETIREWVRGYRELDQYIWCIARRGTDEPLGSVSVVKVDNRKNIAEIGYCLSRSYWGQGIAPEALAEVLRFLTQQVRAAAVEARCNAKNDRSATVLAKCGFVLTGVVPGGSKDNQGISDLACYRYVPNTLFGENPMSPEEMLAYFKRQYERKRNPGAKNHTAQDWDRSAVQWDAERRADEQGTSSSAQRVAKAVEMLTQQGLLTPETEMIDIGCGICEFVAAFAPLVRHVTGTDYSSVMLELGGKYCREQGLDNVTLVQSDFREVSVGDMGWEQRFDLVFASLSPALSTVDTLEKMIRMSRGWCFNNNFIISLSSLENEAARALGIRDAHPRWDGRDFWATWNLLWAMGYIPQNSSYKLSLVNQKEITRDLARLQTNRHLGVASAPEAMVDRVYDHLMRLSDEGMFPDRTETWYSAIAWDVRDITPRW